MCDVAVIGGGPAGCATAIALRQRGVEHVVIVEAGDYSEPRIGESVPPDVRLLLQRLGVWQAFVADAHEPCLGSCSSWGSAELGFNDFVFNPHGTGWHLDRRRFDALLAQQAAADGAELRQRTRCQAVRRLFGGGVELTLSTAGEPGPERLRARFVVDASGSVSRVARMMGAVPRVHDRLTCVTGFAPLDPAAHMTRLTLLEAVEYGWWYAAKLPGGRVALAVASDPDLVKQRGLQTESGWLAHLRATMHVSTVAWQCEALAQPLIARTAASFVLEPAGGSDWLSVGDAASAYDPLSSQGIYKALLDALEASAAIAAALTGRDDALDDYAAAVHARFSAYMATRAFLYRAEARWPSAPFWRHRLDAAAPPRDSAAVAALR